MVVSVGGVGATVVVVVVVVGLAVVVVVVPAVVVPAVVVPAVVVRPEMFGDSAKAGDAPPSTTLEITGTATALAARAPFTTLRRDSATGSSGDV